jgi:hypothetical protein
VQITEEVYGMADKIRGVMASQFQKGVDSIKETAVDGGTNAYASLKDKVSTDQTQDTKEVSAKDFAGLKGAKQSSEQTAQNISDSVEKAQEKLSLPTPGTVTAGAQRIDNAVGSLQEKAETSIAKMYDPWEKDTANLPTSVREIPESLIATMEDCKDGVFSLVGIGSTKEDLNNNRVNGDS